MIRHHLLERAADVAYAAPLDFLSWQITRYRILERASADGRWTVYGVAFEKNNGVYLWMPPWHAPNRLGAPCLAEVSAQDFPSRNEQWRWSEACQWPHKPFAPLEAFQEGVARAAEGRCACQLALDIDARRAQVVLSAAVNFDAACCRGGLTPLHSQEGRALDDPTRLGTEASERSGSSRMNRPLDGPGPAAPEVVLNRPLPIHTLPYPAIFIGREQELLQISTWMDEHRFRVIALTGFGGVGKSTLALHAADRNRGRFRHVVYLSAKDSIGRRRALTLEEVFGRVEAVAGLGNILSRDLRTPDAKSQKAAAVLNAQPSLLILDNLEVLSREETDQLASFLQLLDPRQGTMALLTLRPEHFPPLVDQMKEDLYQLPVGSLEPADAVALLGELLRVHAPKGAGSGSAALWEKVPAGPVPEHHRPRLQALAQRAGVPLEKVAALKELAGMAYHHPFLLKIAVAILRRKQRDWPKMLKRLRGLQGKPLQDKVNDWIGKMYDDLSPDSAKAQTLLQVMLVFSGGATEEALRSVCCGQKLGLTRLDEESFEDAIEAAQDASLLDFDRKRLCYELHPLVRQYLVRRRDPLREQPWPPAQAHANFFLQYAQRHQKDYDTLARERFNLFAAMDWADEARADGMVVQFARCLFDFLWLRGFWKEGRERMLRGVAAACRLANRADEAFLRHAVGILSRELGDSQRARDYHQESLALAEHLENKALKANTLHELGILCRFEGTYEEAERHYKEALALAGKIGNKWLQAMTLHELGVLCSLQGDYKGARHHLKESLTLKKQLDDKVGQARTLHHLGVVCMVQGDRDGARRYYEEARPLEENLGDKGGTAKILHSLGDVCSDQGDYAEARRYYGESLALMEELGDRGGETSTLYSLAKLENRCSNLERAEQLYSRSLVLAEELGRPYWRAANLFDLGLCAQARSQREEARQLFTQARGQREKARQLFTDALAIAERLKMPLADQVRAELQRLG